MFGFGAFGEVPFSAVQDPVLFILGGSAALEFVGTTTFIDMIEAGEVDLAIAAEIRLRSL